MFSFIHSFIHSFNHSYVGLYFYLLLAIYLITCFHITSFLSKIFDANKNRGTEVKHQIDPPITAVALRFHPVTWEGDMCMRVEAFGCDGELTTSISLLLQSIKR